MEHNKKNIINARTKQRANKNIFNLANKLVKEFEKDPNILEKALNLVGKKREDFIEK